MVAVKTVEDGSCPKFCLKVLMSSVSVERFLKLVRKMVLTWLWKGSWYWINMKCGDIEDESMKTKGEFVGGFF